MKSNLENWILKDHNPFIIFSNDGKVIYLNDTGEYILSTVNPKIVYNKIISYIPQKPDFKYIHEKFIFGDFIYDYALIGYDNFDEIGVRFYKNIKPLQKVEKINNLEKLNIYFLLDFTRTYVFIDKDVKFIDIFDPDLPEIFFNKNDLIKLFTDVFKLLKYNDLIKIETKIKIGEHIVFDNQKYKIIQIDIYAKNIQYSKLDYEIVDIKFFDDKISISIPLIKEDLTK